MQRTSDREEMAQQWMVVLTGMSLWATCSAAPTECHYNSQALCVHEGQRYSLGESWMEQGCLQCTCLQPFGVGCCETLQRPVDFPPWCKVHLDSASCKVSLVLTSDPRLPCFPGQFVPVDPIHGAINRK